MARKNAAPAIDAGRVWTDSQRVEIRWRALDHAISIRERQSYAYSQMTGIERKPEFDGASTIVANAKIFESFLMLEDVA